MSTCYFKYRKHCGMFVDVVRLNPRFLHARQATPWVLRHFTVTCGPKKRTQREMWSPELKQDHNLQTPVALWVKHYLGLKFPPKALVLKTLGAQRGNIYGQDLGVWSQPQALMSSQLSGPGGGEHQEVRRAGEAPQRSMPWNSVSRLLTLHPWHPEGKARGFTVSPTMMFLFFTTK